MGLPEIKSSRDRIREEIKVSENSPVAVGARVVLADAVDVEQRAVRGHEAALSRGDCSWCRCRVAPGDAGCDAGRRQREG